MTHISCLQKGILAENQASWGGLNLVKNCGPSSYFSRLYSNNMSNTLKITHTDYCMSMCIYLHIIYICFMCIYFYCKIFLNGFNTVLFKIIGYEQHILFLHDLHVLLKNSHKEEMLLLIHFSNVMKFL